jgi:hypothetical protein
MMDIRLELKDWEKLDPYLEGVCESLPLKLMRDESGYLPLRVECRTVDEPTYQKVLDIARTHCPELVPEIEKAARGVR